MLRLFFWILIFILPNYNARRSGDDRLSHDLNAHDDRLKRSPIWSLNLNLDRSTTSTPPLLITTLQTRPHGSGLNQSNLFVEHEKPFKVSFLVVLTDLLMDLQRRHRVDVQFSGRWERGTFRRYDYYMHEESNRRKRKANRKVCEFHEVRSFFHTSVAVSNLQWRTCPHGQRRRCGARIVLYSVGSMEGEG
jgi:hypothetical protein